MIPLRHFPRLSDIRDAKRVSRILPTPHLENDLFKSPGQRHESIPAITANELNDLQLIVLLTPLSTKILALFMLLVHSRGRQRPVPSESLHVMVSRLNEDQLQRLQLFELHEPIEARLLDVFDVPRCMRTDTAAPLEADVLNVLLKEWGGLECFQGFSWPREVMLTRCGGREVQLGGGEDVVQVLVEYFSADLVTGGSEGCESGDHFRDGESQDLVVDHEPDLGGQTEDGEFAFHREGHVG